MDIYYKLCTRCGIRKECNTTNFNLTQSRHKYSGRSYYRNPCKACIRKQYHDKKSPTTKDLWNKAKVWECKLCLKTLKKSEFPPHNRSSCRSCDNLRKRGLKYGLSYNDVVSLLAGNCEICGRGGNLVLDHCHTTGKFRGAICQSCNSAEGLLQSDPIIVKSLLEYILKHA